MYPAYCQIQVKGKIASTENASSLPFVNIGIKTKNIGTISREDGAFTIEIPHANLSDTLTFSLVGYDDYSIAVKQIDPQKELFIKLREKSFLLDEVVIQGHKLVEKKYGIKKTGSLIHFTDGIFQKDDSFEIGQVINLGNKTAKITSLNLHLNSSRKDSASFRINFYRYNEDENTPTSRIFNKSIIQRHPIKAGWLKFDLSDYNVRLEGKVFASVEFIPENKDVSKIFYEVKIGGSSKSFFRRSSLGQWVRPPHHYCLYVTALADKMAPDEPDDVETSPSFVLASDFSKEPFSIFVRLPKDYSKNTNQSYPVIYHLDGNAYFDPIANSADQLFRKRRIRHDPIIVGIGYENAYLMDSLRARDYTFPASETFGLSGGGDNLYNFIKTKVIPRIDSTYRTERADRTVMGHSLGGYFVLYSLLRHQTDGSVFNNYLAASPSLSYHDDYLIKQFDSLLKKANDLHKATLYITFGELEIKDGNSHTYPELAKLMSTKQFAEIKSKVYKNLEHMGTAIPSFEDGIEFVLTK